MTAQPPAPAQPSLPWRFSSALVMGLVSGLARVGLYVGNRPEVHGLDKFISLVDERQDPMARKRGLITVSNHTSVMDDPLIWGSLPFSYGFRPHNHRWTLGSYDICFQGPVRSTIFNLGQLLPTHRRLHSPFGGLFQPTMTEAIRLLNDCPITMPPESPLADLDSPPSASPSSPPSLDVSSVIPNSTSNAANNHTLSQPHDNLTDPFTSAALTYTTNGIDEFQRPSAFASRRYSWIHIFPEGFVHQHPARAMRYFKWGVARLILEADECPDVVPIWHEGSEKIMPEDRGFPRPVPRLGQRVGIWFGDNVAGAKTRDEGNVFVDLRERWRKLVEQEQAKELKRRARQQSSSSSFPLSYLWSSISATNATSLFSTKSTTADHSNTHSHSSESSESSESREIQRIGRPEFLTDELKHGKEAVALRIECTLRVREAVLAVRRARGLPDEDPKARLVDTYREEGGKAAADGEGKKPDGSITKEM